MAGIFRTLRADEVECRIGSINEKGLSLLLYKDARCDMNVLDETVGTFGWQKEYKRDNANCIVSIFDKHMDTWVSKEDTGTESYTEKEKGLASDSFKRACFNWGIGRELYTAPFIWIKAGDATIKSNNGRNACYDRFRVTALGYDKNGNINLLKIRNDTLKRDVFTYGGETTPAAKKQAQTEQKRERVPMASERQAMYIERCREIHENNILVLSYLEEHGVNEVFMLTMKQASELIGKLNGK